MPGNLDGRDRDYLDRMAEEDEHEARMEYLERVTEDAYREYRENLFWEED